MDLPDQVLADTLTSAVGCVLETRLVSFSRNLSKKSPAQLQREIDEVLASSKSFSAEPLAEPKELQVPFPYERKPLVPSGLHKYAHKGRVNVADLIATQQHVTETGLAKYAKPMTRVQASELPLVYKTDDGRLYIADGHHRLAAAAIRGQRQVDALIVDIGDPDAPYDQQIKRLRRLESGSRSPTRSG